jgi:hypothetical protein
MATGTTTAPSSSATMMSPGMMKALAQAMGALTANGKIFVCAW